MQKKIRNFSIIAHIDHGKSTLSDRIIEICTGKKIKKNKERILDSMELEKEKGITIKSQSVCLKYNYKNINYKFNLIDTPGHIDFSYEVSRSLYACEGALLLIDATQGIQAQTLANYNIAKKLNIKIIPIINKIDLPNKNLKKTKYQIKKLLKIKKKEIILCSAKKGIGIKNIIKKIIKYIPYPNGNKKLPLQALIIDSYFNNYLGIFYLIKIKNGSIKKYEEIKIINKKKKYIIENIYINKPEKKNINCLNCGEVGWISCNIKNIKSISIGDTITTFKNSSKIKLSKFKKISPQIYAELYPNENKNFFKFKKSLEKLSLNDSSLIYKQKNSPILGYGFKCGFLGIFHMEIIKERLEREYKTKIIITPPTVIYKIINKNKKIIYLNNLTEMPTRNLIKEIQEPISICNIITPKKYLGKIIKLCINKRGKQKNIFFFKKNILLIYELPTSEIITNFNNQLKSLSQGYASFEYNFIKYKKSDINLLNININKKKIDGFSILLHKKTINKYSKNIIEIIKKNIKKQQFEVTIQALCNNKIISTTKIKALRKNVTEKCYGGDISRKRKLLKKQKIGKKKMKKIGNIYISPDIFFKTFKI